MHLIRDEERGPVRLPTEFIRLPLHFDVERLRAEVDQFAEADWSDHPQKYAGNSAIPLVAAHGRRNDAMSGPMLPTPHLERCPYMRQVLQAFRTVCGRSRLMRIEEHGTVPDHVDLVAYWHRRVRVHVPIVTDPAVRFVCNGKTVHMAAGEAWIFDTWRPHRVENPTAVRRIHLVIDTSGTDDFWRLVAAGERPFGGGTSSPPAPRFVPFRPEARADLVTERADESPLLHPSDLELVIADARLDLTQCEGWDAESNLVFERALSRHALDWRSLWSVQGAARDALPRYRSLFERLRNELAPIAGRARVAYNGLDPVGIILSRLAVPEAPAAPARSRPSGRVSPPEFDRPIFIVSAPRSGSTLVFETLAACADVWTIGGESHQIFESIGALHPGAHGWHSNRLIARDATPEVSAAIPARFAAELRSANGSRWRALADPERPSSVRMLDKLPKNALRVPFLRCVFEGARFIFLHRAAPASINSIIEAWESGRFVTYPTLPGWDREPWSLLLIPGWKDLHDKTLAEIAAAQWSAANRAILSDLEAHAPDAWTSLSYEEFLEDPAEQVRRVCRFAEIDPRAALDRIAAGTLPLSQFTVSAPDPDKWRARSEQIEPVLPGLEQTVRDLDALLRRRRARVS